MGTLRADTITDGAGTGAPNFTQGATGVDTATTAALAGIVKKSRVGLIKNLGGFTSYSTATDIPDFRFSGLVVGRTYMAFFCGEHSASTSITINNNGVVVSTASSDDAGVQQLNAMTGPFVAAATTLTFDIGAGAIRTGGGRTTYTLFEINDTDIDNTLVTG